MKLNNKGYLLVEVILAGVLAFTMAYFLINLTLKVRNRYDDVNVESLLLNDKTVITNEIMGDMTNNKISSVSNITNGIVINFEDGTTKELTVVDNSIKYGTYVKVLNEGAIAGNIKVKRNNNYYLIEIPITTKYSSDDYGINILGVGIDSAITCTLTTDGTTISANIDSTLLYYGWDSSYSGDNSTSKTISEGVHVYYIKDSSGNTSSCSITILSNEVNCDEGYTLNDTKDSCYRTYNATLGASPSGTCECVGTASDKSNIGGNILSLSCSVNGWGKAFCGCPTGYIVNSNNCSVIYVYKCSTGDTLDNKICYSYKSVVQGCPSGYTKVSDLYCAKSKEKL